MTRLDENRIKRFEENNKVVYEMAKRAKRKSSGTYEEMVTFQLAVIATMLTDISKSLAILADKAESEVSDAENSVAQALNGFADNLERIKNKYGTETEDEESEPQEEDDCTDIYCENCRYNYNCIEYLEEQERINEEDDE